jgi:hypothetical protein
MSTQPQPGAAPTAYVADDRLCFHPASALPEGVCFKCGRQQGIARRPARAKRTERVGYQQYQSVTAKFALPLCARCSFIARNSGALIALAVVAAIALANLGGAGMPLLGVGLGVALITAGPIAAFVGAILIYRRSTFTLENVDGHGNLEIGGVHREALSEVEVDAVR